MSINPRAVPFTSMSLGMQARGSDQEPAKCALDSILGDTQLTLQATGAKLEQLISRKVPAGVVNTETGVLNSKEACADVVEHQNDLEFEDLFRHDDASEDLQTPRCQVLFKCT